MKKLIILLLLAVAFQSANSQLRYPYRVIVVSPNYSNIYPQYNTLQASYLGIKDSASVSTGKRFVINVVTQFVNIADWNSTWKDSIVNRYPYMQLTSFGNYFNDSIIGITVEEFNLIAGILSLDPATAGDGLGFTSHQYYIKPHPPVFLLNDSLWIRLDDSTLSYYAGGNNIYLKRKVGGGILRDGSGVYILPDTPLALVNDTLRLNMVAPLVQSGIYLTLDYSTTNFTLTGTQLGVRIDSGLINDGNGLKVYLYKPRVTFRGGGVGGTALTLPNSIAGLGLHWVSDSMSVLLATRTPVWGLTNPLTFSGDSLVLEINKEHFQYLPDGLTLKADSGITVGEAPTWNPIKALVDRVAIGFNASKQLTLLGTVAGAGLILTSGILSVLTNDFAILENDTLKIKTSTVFVWYSDSLGITMSNGVNVAPYDSTGIPFFAGGKVKRIAAAFKLASGMDTVITQINNVTIGKENKIRLTWISGLSKWSLQKWTVGTRTWVDQFDLIAPSFTSAKWRVSLEAYMEAQ